MRVERNIINLVVVAFREDVLPSTTQLDRYEDSGSHPVERLGRNIHRLASYDLILDPMCLYRPMQHGKTLFREPDKWDVAYSNRAVLIPEKNEIAAVGSWCHRFRDEYDDGNVRSCDHAAAFPDYEEVADSEHKVK